MTYINACELPDAALLDGYQKNGAYTDCYTTEIDRAISHAEFVNTFYTTWLFKIERLILSLLVAKSSTDAEAKLLAEGKLNAFAAWSVEQRAANQILMCDFQSKTRSWLMTESIRVGENDHTRLYFGSAVVPMRDWHTGQASMGFGFRALLGFHKLYSRALLSAAKSKLIMNLPTRF